MADTLITFLREKSGIYLSVINDEKHDGGIAGLHVTSRRPSVGGQEQKHFSPLGTKLHFHVNSLRKILLF